MDSQSPPNHSKTGQATNLDQSAKEYFGITKKLTLDDLSEDQPDHGGKGNPIARQI